MPKIGILLILTGLTFFRCNSNTNRETLTQVGTIDALLGGIYDGEYSLIELARHGDFGLGTFNTLNGEMIILDGKIYQATADGKVALADLNGKTPFASVTYFDSDSHIAIPAGTNFDSLIKHIVVGVNVPGYHLYFITKDRQAGGHLLTFTIAEKTLAQNEHSKRRSEI